MTTDALRSLVLRLLQELAPETDPASVDPDADLREELDLDSMDELNLIARLSEELGCEVPEAEYPQLRTVNGAVDYLADRLARQV